jgi:hypothetical protein
MKENMKHMSNDPDIPEGLEYRDDYWQDALRKIERHERRVAFKRVAWLSGALALLLVAAYVVYTPSNELASSNSKPGLDILIPEDKNVQQMKDDPEDSIVKDKLNDDQVEAQVEDTKVSQIDLTKRGKISPSNSKENKKRNLSVEYGKNDLPFNENTIVADNPKENPKEMDDSTGEDDIPLIGSKDVGTSSEPSGTRMSQSDRGNELFTNSSDVVQPETANTSWNCTEHIASMQGSLLSYDRGLMTGKYLPYRAPWIEPKWRMTGYVGLSLVTHYSSPINDIKTDPMVGVNMEFNPSNRWAIRGGLEYFSIGNVRRPYSMTSVAYDINYIHTVTTVETHQLYYLSLPLTGAYRFNRSHQIWFGGGLSYMITGRNEITMHRVTPDEDQLLGSYEDVGFVSGFVDFPWFVHGGYEWRFRKNAFFSVGYQFGLTDITRNAYFGSPSVDRNTRIMFTLGIDCFKR